MAVIGAGVSLRGIKFEDSHVTMNLASGITQSDEGKAVALDTSAANTAKLAGDGDIVFGRLERVEDRQQEGVLVGTVALRFIERLPIDGGAAGTWAIGDSVVGGGDGEVKIKGEGTPAPDPTDNTVVELDVSNGYVIVAKV